MKRSVCLFFLLTGILAHCVSVPRQPEPMPLAPEAVPKPAQPEEAPPSQELLQPEPYTHEVRWSGETLSHIALWYTGSQNNWQKIARANASLKPIRISIGDRILIPEELLKTRKPMPRDYLRSFAAPKRTETPETVQPQKDPRNEELFGPVELLSPQGASEKNEFYGPVELFQGPEHSKPSSGDR